MPREPRDRTSTGCRRQLLSPARLMNICPGVDNFRKGTHLCSLTGGQTERRPPITCAPKQDSSGIAVSSRKSPIVSESRLQNKDGNGAHHHRITDKRLQNVQRAPEHLREVAEIVVERGGSRRRKYECLYHAREIGRHVLTVGRYSDAKIKWSRGAVRTIVATTYMSTATHTMP